MVKSKSVKQFMTSKLVTFTPEMNVYDAMKLLVDKRISGGPVINEAGDIVGILSEVDCHKTLLDSTYNNYPSAHVGDVMSKEVFTVDADLSIHALAEKFLAHNRRRYPVVEDGKLIGQISRRDVLVAIQSLREE